MGSSLAETNGLVQPSNLDALPINPSPVRSRILKQSIIANRKTSRFMHRPARWTKRPKYEGFQSTLDLNDGLKPLRNFKCPKGDPATTSLELSSSYPYDQSSDPVMRELDEIALNAKTGSSHSAYSQSLPGEKCLLWESTLADDDVSPDTQSDLEHKQVYETECSQPTQDWHSGTTRGPSDPRYPDLDHEPDQRPITQEELAAEVKKIYSGLTMVEAKCIREDEAQAAVIRSGKRGDTDYRDEYWKALIAHHRTLLQEHHDFFLASQHPSASPALRSLALRYAMPNRMYRHGIHSLLNLLLSLEGQERQTQLLYMSAFLQYAHQTVTTLREDLPNMDEQWTKIDMALLEYDAVLQDLRSESFGESDAKPLPEASAYNNSTRPTSRLRYLYERTAPGNSESNMTPDFGDLYARQHGYYIESEVSTSSWTSLSKSVRPLQYVVNTLSGWLYFGQSIAWNDFNIYAKVFGVLSVAAKQYSALFL